MNWSVSEVTQPEVEPVSLEEAKLHLRVDDDSEDALISAQITAAREWVEAHIGYVTVQRQLKLVLDYFPDGDTITLPRSKLISIDSVEYVDTDGATQTWSSDNYSADTNSEEGRLILDPDSDWPDTRDQRQAVTITYTAGWPDDGASPPDYAAMVPNAIKAAIKLIVGNLYENRESVVVGTGATDLPMAVLFLLSPYRRMYL